METVEAALNYIHSRPKGDKAGTQQRMAALLAALGNPEQQLPKAIHVTGTNGKGSVATMASAILTAAGYRTGLFVSPYIVDFRERIQVDQEWISPADLVTVTKRVKDAVEQLAHQAKPMQVTEFELVTAIMFTYFAELDLGAVVIEVGIGGQNDATNALTANKVPVITSVALDHQEILGPDITSIVQQKAGIIPPGQPVVVGQLPDDAKVVIAKRASQLIRGRVGEFEPGLPGQYQAENTATAVAAVRQFDPEICPAEIKTGLAASKMPGRFERVAPNLILDGAHNPAGLAALLAGLRALTSEPVTLIIGSLADKHLDQVLPELARQPQFEVILVPFTGPNGRAALDAKTVAAKYQVGFAKDWATALTQAPADRLKVLTGSLYFVSEVRKSYE
ncbi:Mur ligase family protein [Leuconostocaceae bacterium ESL0723]|nr:Mur ligase family protein [Leuconostocaceae bacterium ESL0723]